MKAYDPSDCSTSRISEPPETTSRVILKTSLPPSELMLISQLYTPSERPVVSTVTVMVSCSPLESPLVGVTSTQLQDSLNVYVSVPVPLFQMSNVVLSVSSISIFPKS